MCNLQHAEPWSSARLCADDAAQWADKKIDTRHRSQSYHSLEHTKPQEAQVFFWIWKAAWQQILA